MDTNLKIYEKEEEMNRFMAEELQALLKENKKALICIAAGNTSLGLFEQLINMVKKGEIDFSEATFVAMDEWLGMNEDTPGSCSDFLNRNFLRFVNFAPERTRLVNGCAEDIEAECREIGALIESFGGMDYLVLGCGMNGHLALNEPGVDFDSTVHQTVLDPVTQKVGQKYFPGAVELRGGVTIGILEIKNAKRVVLALNSASKQEILKKIVDSPVSPQIPATVVKSLKQGLIVCDREVAGAL